MRSFAALLTALMLVLGFGLSLATGVGVQPAAAAGPQPVPAATKKATSASPSPTMTPPAPVPTGKSAAVREGERWVQLAIIAGGGLLGCVLVFFGIGAILRHRPRR